MAVVEAHHLWHHKTGHVEQTLDVGVYHLVPVLKTALVFGLKATGESGIVYQHVNRLETLGDACNGLARGLAVAHVKSKREHIHAQSFKLNLQSLESVGCAACNNKIVATIGKTTCASFAYSACCACDKSCFSFHSLLVFYKGLYVFT